ncbi:Lrp/AsnC family transcriptional regulator [Christensenella sp. MSJ-20]|uniref:Lrp/AsnC family transcriptional regulator n=1 Tax=Christensenella sp. MSJ-20 TaxID=2841518 RepID=UPI000D79AF80|nr:MAG: AsnC family transcriptional regulator [Bacillota bacterium]QWT55163.1 Lrp/AsnC family transcriptional regulator [Christensenella sp. MSJ-20]
MESIKKDVMELLKENSRTSAADMAVMLNAEEQAVLEAIRALEDEKLILKYTAILNEEKLADSHAVTALIEVRVSPMREMGFDAIARRIYRFEEVESVFLMSGAYDLMVLIKGDSMRQIAFFVAQKLATIDGVLSTATHFVLKKYKELGVVFETAEEEARLPVTP